MTVIVGVCDGSSVWMGADSLAGNSAYVLNGKLLKIVRLPVPLEGGSEAVMLIGSSGDFRPSFLLSQMALPEHEKGIDVLVYVAGKVVDCVRSAYRDNGYLQKESEREGGNCHILIGYQGRLFSMWDEFQVVETADPYMAVGSGMYLALGALAATERIKPERRVELALLAAEKHNPYVRRPFQFEHVEVQHG